MGLRGRLLSLVLLAVAPAFVLIVHSSREERAAADAEVRLQTRRFALVVADEQRRLIDQGRHLLETLIQLPLVRDPDLLRLCPETFARIRANAPVYGNVGMVDAEGNLLCSALPFKPGTNIADRSWFQRALGSRQFAVGDYLVGRLSGLPSLTLSLPLLDESGKPTRIVFAAINLSWLQALAGKLALPEGAAVAIIDATGTILAREPDPERAWTGKPTPERGEIAHLTAGECRGLAEFRGSDGVMRLNAIEPLLRVDGGCVYARVGISREVAYRPIDRRHQRDLILMTLVSLLALGVAWWGGEFLLLKPLRALGAAARRLGRGERGTRAGLPSNHDELGRLADAFEEMAQAIDERENRLEEADRVLHRANRALSVLSACNRAMLRTREEAILLDAMCRAVVERGGYVMAWVGYAADGETIQPMARFGVDIERLDPRCLSRVSRADGESPQAAAMRSGQAQVLRVGPGHEALSCMRDTGCIAALALPLCGDNGVFGVISLYARDADAFDANEIELLGEAAADLAFGISRLRDQARRREAEEANRIKSEFLANMSHELRTPLNAIIGFSEVMKDGLIGEMAEQQREFITDIYSSGRHLLSLINDILDLSKVEAGRMELDLDAANVAELATNSLSIVREKAAAHAITLAQEIAPDLPPIAVDARKTKQIIYNLLSNAVKFTPDRGRVTLRARKVARAEVEAWAAAEANHLRLPLPGGERAEYAEFADFLEISVEDNGIGIKPEDAPRLFQPFSQIDAALDRRFEGTGLGLAMVMKLSRLHGGTVAVASEAGKGSRFTVWLPWRGPECARAKPAPPAAPATARRRALVLEDNDEAAALIAVQLEAEGLETRRVRSAEAALELIADERPSVIVLDILLPGIDGWDFLARIKEPGSPWAETPVVICSIVADSKRGFSLGAAQVLQKPVGREELAAALAAVGLHRPDGRRRRVLVVDDDREAVELLAAYLPSADYDVLRAFGGREAITLARDHQPDLIVLDLLMPEVSGFDVVEAIRSAPSTESIPIIVVTARRLSEAERASLNGHVLAVLEKTDFNHERFLGEVRRALTGETVARR